MPSYDFQCERCGRVFERRMTMAEYGAGRRSRCPDCGDPETRRVFSSSVNILTSRAGPDVTYDSPGGCGSGGGSCGSGSCGCTG